MTLFLRTYTELDSTFMRIGRPLIFIWPLYLVNFALICTIMMLFGGLCATLVFGILTCVLEAF